MANHGFETGSNESNAEKDASGTPKKYSAASGLPRFERPIGRTEPPQFIQRPPTRPLGEAMTSAAKSAKEQPQPEVSRSNMGLSSAEDEQPSYRHVTADEVAARAAQAHHARLQNMHHAHEEARKAEKKDDSEVKDSSKEGAASPAEPDSQDDRTHRLTREEWGRLMSPAVKFSPAETRVKAEGDVQPPGAVTEAKNPTSDDEHSPRFVPQEDSKDSGTGTFAESEDRGSPAAEEENSFSDFADKFKADAEFQDFMDRHPEVHNLAVPAANDDETFHNETSESSDAAQWHEEESGEPPRNAGNQPPRPPLPPTTEGGAWSDDEPESGGFDNRHIASAELLNNPWVHAGNLATPAATLGDLSALEARQRLDSLQHTTREAGLAGAVGILGLGLVVEHFIAKRRDKKQQRQINKHHKEAIHTQKALAREQVTHRQTRQELHRLQAEHGATSERLGWNTTSNNSTGETASAAAAVVATELARKKVLQAEAVESVPLSSTARRELQKQIDADPALALAVEKSRAHQENVVFKNEARAREIYHERLSNRVTDRSTVTTRTATVPHHFSNGAYAATPAHTSTSQSAYMHANGKKHTVTDLLAYRWTWAIVGFIAVAVLFAAFAL
jgi:hypothetical protein